VLSDFLVAVRLAETMCARICHDLGGPLGTVDACLELIGEGATDTETVAAADAAAKVLEARLRLLRAAWGPHPAALTLADLHDLAAGLPQARKLTLDTDRLPQDARFAAGIGRALAAVLLLAAQALPKGGRISLLGTVEDVLIRIAGPQAAWPGALAAALHDAVALEPLLAQPRELALVMAVLIARTEGLRLSILVMAGDGTGPSPLRLCAAS